MAANKKTFIFYSDWINMVREMPNEDAGELLKHILSYVNDETPETKNLLVKMAFGHMKPLLKKDLIQWEKQLERFSTMGKASAEKRKNKHNPTYVEPTLTQVERMNTVNDNVNVNVSSIKNTTSSKEVNEEFDEFSRMDIENAIPLILKNQSFIDRLLMKYGKSMKLKATDLPSILKNQFVDTCTMQGKRKNTVNGFLFHFSSWIPKEYKRMQEKSRT